MPVVAGHLAFYSDEIIQLPHLRLLLYSSQKLSSPSQSLKELYNTIARQISKHDYGSLRK